MGKQKQTRKFAVAKKLISSKDARMSADLIFGVLCEINFFFM
jgi:hypothetical protein